MASAAKTGPQDLPPRGGYAPIQIERINLRTIIGGRLGISLFLASTFGGYGCYAYTVFMNRKNDIEMRSSRLAITPLLQAERDRAILKHMRRVRDEEADLMKGISSWEVGTLFGEPIYETVPEDTYREPSMLELVVHSEPTAWYLHVFHYLFT